jgi:hypothetical protein
VNSEILKAVLEEASALTSWLPEGIQPAAFAKAFDVLIDQRAGANRRRGAVSKQGPPRQYEGSSRNSGARSRRVGPKFALGQLLNSGYFNARRSLPEIQGHLKDSHGHDYGSNELSISLLRLIRDARLNREKGPSGQYEYWAAGLARESTRADGLQHVKARTRLLTDGKER